MIFKPGTGVLFMKVGTHAQESLEDIIKRKLKEVDDAGFAILTASQISARIPREIARTCGTSRQQSLADCVNRSAVQGRDRVGDVALRPQRRRLGVGNHGGGEAF